MRLGVRQPQGGAPRSTKHHPTFDAEVFAQAFDIRDQILRVVTFEFGMRPRMPASALVEQYCAVTLGIEESAVIRLAASARTAVQKHRRQSIGSAAFLHV
jgi:hypothetical protein